MVVDLDRREFVALCDRKNPRAKDGAASRQDFTASGYSAGTAGQLYDVSR